MAVTNMIRVVANATRMEVDGVVKWMVVLSSVEVVANVLNMEAEDEQHKTPQKKISKREMRMTWLV